MARFVALITVGLVSVHGAGGPRIGGACRVTPGPVTTGARVTARGLVAALVAPGTRPPRFVGRGRRGAVPAAAVVIAIGRGAHRLGHRGRAAGGRRCVRIRRSAAVRVGGYRIRPRAVPVPVPIPRPEDRPADDRTAGRSAKPRWSAIPPRSCSVAATALTGLGGCSLRVHPGDGLGGRVGRLGHGAFGRAGPA